MAEIEVLYISGPLDGQRHKTARLRTYRDGSGRRCSEQWVMVRGCEDGYYALTNAGFYQWIPGRDQSQSPISKELK